MKIGAFDYILKPWDEITTTIDKAVVESRKLSRTSNSKPSKKHFIGSP
jgi:DNA-binding NtrC family response regulator